MKYEFKKKVKKIVEVEETVEFEMKKTYVINIVEVQQNGTLKTVCRVTDFFEKPDDKVIAEILYDYKKAGRKVFATVFENYCLN